MCVYKIECMCLDEEQEEEHRRTRKIGEEMQKLKKGRTEERLKSQ